MDRPSTGGFLDQSGWTIKAALLILFVLWIVVTFAAAPSDGSQDRPKTPAESMQEMNNPVPQSAEALKRGAVLYEKNCTTCHGKKGKGDGPAARYMDKKPADISSPGLGSRLKDGEIYWKISEGAKPMPPFEKKLTENERWVLVHYVKTVGKIRGE